MNSKVRFNEGWTFAKSSLGTTDWNALNFEQVDIPHDWLIYNTQELNEDSIGWYRKVISWSPDWDGQELVLCFDGVYMDSYVYVNGKVVGEWKYGYSAFEHVISDALVQGDNELVVKVVHQAPNSRWYSGAGIYRNVWLKTRGPSHIVTDGIYVSTKQEDPFWQLNIETELRLSHAVQLTHTLWQAGQAVAAIQNPIAQGELIDAQTSPVITSQLTMQVQCPLLWSPDTPHLYQLVTTIHRLPSQAINGQLHAGQAEVMTQGVTSDLELLETISQSIGFRDIVLDPEQGLLLNGKPMKLNGVCEHHDLGALGAAFNKAALLRRLRLLKEMGANAIRTAHNMPAKELMELTDELGLLVVSEAFDMWERPKTPYDYARFFGEWAERDVRSWIRRDRNHPSLMLWSIGNEIYDTHADERGQEITLRLMEYVQQHDPRKNASVTIGSNYMPWENARKCADLVKVAGYNYGDKYYAAHHLQYPDWIIYGSETASVVSSRGVYHFPYEQSILTEDDRQCSSLGNSPTSWGARSAEACILAERDTPFSLGQFIWTGFDYIGEPTPYHTKSSYFGQLDTATFKKDAYFIYQAAWTDYRTNPMVHLLPYWDFNPGQMIDVRVCSNAPKVELRLNGRSLGIHYIDHTHGHELLGWWKVPYEPGELVAIAYDDNGRVLATDTRASFGDPERIVLHADSKSMLANGTDLIFVEIAMKDGKGRIVENANNRIHVEVTGAGRLLGLDNGDSTDYDPYKGRSRRLFSGKVMAIIGSTLHAGSIQLRVSSPGLPTASILLDTVVAVESGELGRIDAQQRNEDLPIVTGCKDEIPVRKIELISEGGQQLDPMTRAVIVRAELHPPHATYPELEWSVVNEAGIVSNMARIVPAGNSATVIAIGDGDFRVRCTSRNGTEHIRLMSQLEFTGTGLGPAFKNPYEFISAGLYDYSQGDLSNGNEKGVATSRDGETQVGFHELDFGPLGADTITIPIFALSSEPYALQIWEGIPGEAGSTMLADVIYQKESRWNVYQEETYVLSQPLRGITSVCFVLQEKVHIKGFSFEPINRAFARHTAAASDHIYGDTFTVTGDFVEGIGNNVSLEYLHMDFQEEGADQLILYGRSSIDKNTLHLRFHDGNQEHRQLLEFHQSDDYTERMFQLEPVRGMQKVTFLFLPGSQFDFGWFQFRRSAGRDSV